MLPSNIIEEYLNTASKIVEKAGVILVNEFKNNKTIRNQGIANYDIKINSDQLVEKFIITSLKDKFKGHGFASEESEVENIENDFVWYIDPIDGTNNFAIGIPYFGISLVLTFKGEPIVSIIFNPVLNELFSSGSGIGAFKNGVKFEYRGTERSLNEAVISFIRGHQTFSNPDLLRSGDNLHGKLIKANPKRIITFWAPIIDYTLLVQGKIDLLISFEDELQEAYAGSLLCREAHVPIYNLDGNKATVNDKKFIIGNEKLIQEVLNILR